MKNVSDGAEVDHTIYGLVVEPSGFYSEHLLKVMREIGYQCDAAYSLEEARSSIKRIDYQMIIIARHLPDGLGMDLAKSLREQAETSRTPLIMLTADEDQQIFQEGYTAGFTEVFFRGELARLADYLQYSIESRQRAQQLFGKVLYLEDQKWIADVTIGILHNLGLRVDHFTSVPPALKAFEENDYDLVVTDIVLEGAESGVSMVRSVRRTTGKKANIPILAMTGVEDATRRIELFRAGVTDYVQKPAITEELIARVSHLIVNQQLWDTIQKQQNQLESLARVDVLTGLCNRRDFPRAAGQIMSEYRVSGEHLSLLLIGIDGYEQLNSDKGYEVGDYVLKEYGDYFRQLCEDQAWTPARWRGEEFLLLCEKLDHEQALALAERIGREVSEREFSGCQTSVSVGVASLEGEEAFREFLEHVYSAFTRAKAGGSKQIVSAKAAPQLEALP